MTREEAVVGVMLSPIVENETLRLLIFSDTGNLAVMYMICAAVYMAGGAATANHQSE